MITENRDTALPLLVVTGTIRPVGSLGLTKIRKREQTHKSRNAACLSRVGGCFQLVPCRIYARGAYVSEYAGLWG